MTELFDKKVTIYNDIPERKSGSTVVTPRSFLYFVLNSCNVQGQFVQRSKDTEIAVVNAKTVITKDVAQFKNPSEFDLLPADKKGGFFTARVGDFIVFDEVDDVVATASDWAALQAKYKDNGMRVGSVSVYKYGMDVDNITFTNV